MKSIFKSVVREVTLANAVTDANGHKIVKIPYGSNDIQRLKAVLVRSLNYEGTGTVGFFPNLSRFNEEYSKHVTPAGAPIGVMATPNANAFNNQWGVLSTGNQNVTGTFRQQYYSNNASVAYDSLIKSAVGNDLEDCFVIVFMGAATGTVRLTYQLEYAQA